MIVLDTTAMSEAFRGTNASPQVAAWYANQATANLYVCAPVMAVLRFGVLRLTPGRRKNLDTQYPAIRAQFRSRILSFDLRAVEALAELVTSRFAAGKRSLFF